MSLLNKSNTNCVIDVEQPGYVTIEVKMINVNKKKGNFVFNLKLKYNIMYIKYGYIGLMKLL